MTGIVLDTGALIALDKGDRGISVLVEQARRDHDRITVPASVVAQAWRDPKRQAKLAAFLRLSNVHVVALDAEEARLIGGLLAVARRSDIVDAHVALCGVRFDQVVVTSDRADIERLAPTVRILAI